MVLSTDMTFLHFIPIVLSLLVLGAHFLRGGSLLTVIGMFGLLGLLAVRRAWVARLVQVVLILGALEWFRTLVVLALRRSGQGEPFLRMALILGTVAAITLASALLFESSALKRLYRGGP
ncbi:MAG: hypothetical protein GY769_02105 [bacterium]|nr:hypothetical protein [bacterium]